MRWLVTEKFGQLVLPSLRQGGAIAVVGGVATEPEVELVRSRGMPNEPVDITYFGIEKVANEDWRYLDLNAPMFDRVRSFDLVLCSHVVEHVFDVRQAIANLIQLSKPGGLVWISCPASCHAHGSPAFFSSGYQPELLTQLAMREGAQVICSGLIGSKRAYYYEHTIRRWPDRAEFERPLLGVPGGDGGMIRKTARFAKTLPSRFLATFRSSDVREDPDFAIQTWLLLKAGEGAVGSRNLKQHHKSDQPST